VEGQPIAENTSSSNQGINDLATSPDNPLIVASASDDTTIRIWSLAAAHEKQPCVCILGGESHSYDLLSVVCMVWDTMSPEHH
jgi:polycomb protein EED